MFISPFSLLRPFENRLTIGLFTKADDIRTDADTARTLVMKDVATAKILGAKNAASLNQMHGKRTVIVREPTNRPEQADGMITDVPGLALCIRWADCQNFVVYAPDHHVLGAVHIGWRCLRDGTIPSFFEMLKREFDIDAEECLVAGGPSLCMKCGEFSDPLSEIPNVPQSFVSGKLVDLRGWALQQFTDAGVDIKNIEMHLDCTRCHPETYWTYRGGGREEVKSGYVNMLVCCLK